MLALRVAKQVPAYVAAKAGLLKLTEALALEWAAHRIRVNALAPGYVETDLNRDFLRSPAGEAMAKRVPMRRFGAPGDLDGALLLLASDAGATSPAPRSAWTAGTRWPGCDGRRLRSMPLTDALRARVDAFVRTRIVPLESDPANDDGHGSLRLDVLERLRADVKAEGLWAPQLPREFGGLGLPMRALVAAVRGDGRLDLRAGRVQLRSARRRQHAAFSHRSRPTRRRRAGWRRSPTGACVRHSR